jgi:hypothetical protein
MIAVRTIAAVLCLTMTAPVLAEESYPKVPKMFTSKGFVEFYGSNREHELAKVYVHGLLERSGDANVMVRKDTGRQLFCWPEHYAIVEDQLVAVVKQFIENNQWAGNGTN